MHKLTISMYGEGHACVYLTFGHHTSASAASDSVWMSEDNPCCGDACSRIVLRPAMVCGLIDLWHPYPGQWTGTIQSVVELLDDLVDALRCDTEPSTCISTGDGVVSG